MFPSQGGERAAKGIAELCLSTLRPEPFELLQERKVLQMLQR